MLLFSPVAQLAERRPLEPDVSGSNPDRAALARSFSGRTIDSQSINSGSNPLRATGGLYAGPPI